MIAYAVNLRTGAVTRYTHWPFRRMARFQGMDIAVDGSGVCRIGADGAEGAPIQAEVRLDGLQFGAGQRKRLRRVYLYYRPGGALDVGLAPDARAVQFYRMPPTSKPLDTRRVRVGRGPDGASWSLVLRNVNGGRLDVDRIDLTAEILSRKV